MAEKELRKMNRTELIEIIYALQQNDRTLQEENDELHRQLEDKKIRIEQAGSIAEAALSLNHIFEDAEAAARQYLDSIRDEKEEGRNNSATVHISLEEEGEDNEKSISPSESAEEELPVQVQQEEDRIREEAQKERDRILDGAEQECEILLRES